MDDGILTAVLNEIYTACGASGDILNNAKSLFILSPVLYHRILTIKNLWKRILSLLTMLKKVSIMNLPKLKSKLKANLKVRKILKEKQNQRVLSVDYCYFHYLTFINQIHLINSYYIIDSENI